MGKVVPLTDKERKEILFFRSFGCSIRQTAFITKRSITTVKKVTREGRTES